MKRPICKLFSTAIRPIGPLLLFVFLVGKLVGQSTDNPVATSKPLTVEKRKEFERSIAELQQQNSADTIYDIINWRYKRIGEYYDSLGDAATAFDYYRLAITFGDFDYGFRKRAWFPKITSRFIAEKQYDSVLYYHDIIQACKPRKIGCGMGREWILANYNYWLMMALDGKDLLDSAIQVFSPYAFMQWTNNEGTEVSTKHLFEGDYHCQMLYFIRLMERKHGFASVCAEVLRAPDAINLRPTFVSNEGSCYYEIDFYPTVGGREQKFYGWMENCKPYEANKKELNKTYSEFFSEYIRNSFIYRYYTEMLVL